MSSDASGRFEFARRWAERSPIFFGGAFPLGLMLRAEPVRIAAADCEAKAAPFLAARVLAVVDKGAGLDVGLGSQFVTHVDRLLGGRQTAGRMPVPNSDGRRRRRASRARNGIAPAVRPKLSAPSPSARFLLSTGRGRRRPS